MSDPTARPTKAERARSQLVLEGVPGPRSWKVRLLMLAAWLGLCGATAAAVGLLVVYARFSPGLPDIPKVAEYWPPIVSEVFTDDGVLAGEYYSERRKVVPYERIPKRLVQAFIASEDSSFFDHGGVDYLGTARAAFKTIFKKVTGKGSVQGGSTLTQQTAKSLLVTAELDKLDPDLMQQEADRQVGPMVPPTKEAIRAEMEALRPTRGPLELPDDATAEERAEAKQARENDLRDQATSRLNRQSELAHADAVKTAFLRIKEARTRAAFQKATEKKLQRKIREAILARRLEAALTKEEILYLYLNNVYLGHHSYGVQSAAENYFHKDVRELTLGQISLIAGLPQAPSRYSPFRNPEAARKRRSYVLQRMLTEGMISKQEHDQAAAEEIHVYPVEDVARQFAPYFTEEVRRDLAQRYGSGRLLSEGLKIFTTMDSERQRAAQEAVFQGLLEVDKRQGYRGPLLKLQKPSEREAFLAKSTKALAGEPIQRGRFYAGLVTSIDEKKIYAKVQVGPHQGLLPLLGMRWARKVNAEQYYPGVMISKVTTAIAEGDVVLLRAVDKKGLYDDKEQFSDELYRQLPEGEQLFRLEQEPEPQSALVSIDPHRQYLVAMVGGYDFDANEYNRAFQACRQPGSAFKPLVYSAAIDKLNWTEATVIVDSPIVYDDPQNQSRWKPANYSEEFVGDVLLRTALVNSMNIPAVKTFIAVGIKDMAEWVKKLGLTSSMNLDFSSALGSSCVYPVQLAQVYATFNRLGEKKPTYFIRKVEDRFGRMLEDHTAYDDPWAGLSDRVAAGYARLYEQGEQVMSRESAFILTHLLRGVVQEGTGAPASRLGKPAAGKTGTTNDSFDAWFVGFTRDLVTASWVGYDLNPHPLGRFETGGRAALPIWLDYMKRALEGRSQPEFAPPPGLELLSLRIDTKTGKVASSGTKNVADMWFKKDTEPKDQQPEKGQMGTEQFLMQ